MKTANLSSGRFRGRFLSGSERTGCEVCYLGNYFGRVRGVDNNGIKIFKGIPYGANTSGMSRFMAPAEPAKAALRKVSMGTSAGERRLGSARTEGSRLCASRCRRSHAGRATCIAGARFRSFWFGFFPSSTGPDRPCSERTIRRGSIGIPTRVYDPNFNLQGISPGQPGYNWHQDGNEVFSPDDNGTWSCRSCIHFPDGTRCFNSSNQFSTALICARPCACSLALSIRNL